MSFWPSSDQRTVPQTLPAGLPSVPSETRMELIQPAARVLPNHDSESCSQSMSIGVSLRATASAILRVSNMRSSRATTSGPPGKI